MNQIETGPFEGLQGNGYQILMCDPPWNFKARSDKGVTERAAAHHYEVQDLDWIKSLPVADLAAKRSVLLLWVTDTHLEQAFEVIDEWGFEFKTVGFYWAKLNKKADTFAVGMGFYTRANPEMCLLCVPKKGRAPERVGKGVRRLIENEDPKLIVSRIREHSRKPDEAFERAVELFGDVPRVELFSRETREGWAVWGNETGKLDDPFRDVDFDEVIEAPDDEVEDLL